MRQSVETTIVSFKPQFYQLVEQVPAGRVTSYGALAEALGDKRAARAVGKMLNQNPKPVSTPCHRVVRSNGKLGGYVQGKETKKELLDKEGININNDQIEDFSKRFFAEFDCDQPLKQLKRAQLAAKDRVSIENKTNEVDLLGGIDASYEQKQTKDMGYVALYLEDKQKRLNNEEKTITIEREVDFPYIPTYLAFRELPLFLQVLNKARADYGLKPDLLLVDGNGLLHPDKFGLACHLGVEASIPTIGVSKSLLCGRLEAEITEDQRQTVIRDVNNHQLGHALLSSNRASKPIYISPGHLTDFDQALTIVKNNCQYKIPRPIRQAHLAANELRRRQENDSS